MGHQDASSGDLPAGGSDQVFRDALQLIAEGVTEIVGFQLATISVVRQAADGTEELEVIADAGDDPSGEIIVGRRTPLASLLMELEKAEVWGQFRFLPHELLETEDVENAYGWVVPDFEPIDAPDAWHPLDLLVALLHDDHGVLRGTLAIDLPENGRRPGEDQRALLEKYATMAGRAVVTTLEREELAEQVRLADTARTIVRNASAQRDLGEVLADLQDSLARGFRARGSWIQTFDEDGRGSGAVHSANGIHVDLPDEFVDLAERSARYCWAHQVVQVVGGRHPLPAGITEEERATIVDFLDAMGIGSLLFVPLGAGAECLGNLVLTRSGREAWTELDRRAALDIGHDLGRVILNARTFQREHELVVELQALDTYKSQLIATVSHELKNPLTAITGYLEILESADSLDPSSRSAVDAMGRGAARLSRVVEDLLLLSKVGDPHQRMIAAEVDVKRVVDEVTDLVAVTARHKDLTVAVDVPADPVTAWGDATEVDRLVSNLVSNAVKYTPSGRRVDIRLRCTGDRVVLEVADEGFGISAADQERLFEEFFRSSHHQAAQQPGTGLGLAIVKRIVERHGGEISVASELGVGSTFTVSLPAAT
ncbi:HAMP domain-containing sensor histidine kinase [Nocardioides sp.]|uniref:HAMP domain-containing sensor histidine kinase n=1 Tax=Nocardioides sp. TaxID=35761 RepID=UPI002ED4E0AF